MSNIVDVEQVNALEFSVEDTTNPRSIVSLTSGIQIMQESLKRLLAEAPDLLDLEFHEIKQMVNPSNTLARLRQSFWNEYENAIQSNRKMKLGKFLAGVCTDRLFRVKVANNNKKLAYILSPPKDYLITMKEALDAGLDNLRAIATAPVIAEDGSLNTKAADVVLKAIALLDMRVKGAVVQRIDQRNLNLNMNRDVTGKEDQSPRSMEELDRELEQVKMKLVRDVTQAKLPPTHIQQVELMETMQIETIDIPAVQRSKE